MSEASVSKKLRIRDLLNSSNLVNLGETMSETIKTATMSEIKGMIARGETFPTRADAPEHDMPEGFWDSAVLVRPMFDASGSRTISAEEHDEIVKNGSSR